MTTSTKTAVSAILAADGTITPAQINAALSALGGTDTVKIPRIVRPREAAELLGVCTMTVRRWAKAGVLTPVYSPASRTCKGYTAESVRRLANGEMPRLLSRKV